MDALGHEYSQLLSRAVRDINSNSTADRADTPRIHPGDHLPLPSFPHLPKIAVLTPAANAAIGTFAATMPLFYAGMDTLFVNEFLGGGRITTNQTSFFRP
jgi:hypothetical protein